MKDEIKKGDEVRLVTGGPIMTVTQVQEDQAECEWMVVDKLLTMTFKVKNLVQETANESRY